MIKSGSLQLAHLRTFDPHSCVVTQFGGSGPFPCRENKYFSPKYVKCSFYIKERYFNEDIHEEYVDFPELKTFQ